MLIQHTLDLVQGLLAPPTPTPSTTGDPATDSTMIINTAGLIAWVGKAVVPLLLMASGVFIMARARLGRVSEAATTSGISLWGIAFIAGALAFMALGNKIVNLVIG